MWTNIIRQKIEWAFGRRDVSLPAQIWKEFILAEVKAQSRLAYRIIGLEVHLAPDGSFELSGDVVSFSKMEISSA